MARNVENTVETNNPRTLNAIVNYDLFAEKVLQCLSQRYSINFTDTITSNFLFYLKPDDILTLKKVSKNLHLSYISCTTTINTPLKSIDSNPSVKENYKYNGPRNITKEMINKLPLYQYEGPTIEVISSLTNAQKAISILTNESILGFDTETRPAFKKGEHYPPSLIQIASKDRVYIFQLHSITLEPFKPLLENENIIKTGIGIKDDIIGLKRLGTFNPSGFIEISRLESCKMIKNKGLRALAAALFGVRISKNAQMSNWAKPNLTDAQIKYAATDAWISRQIYMKLNSLS